MPQTPPGTLRRPETLTCRIFDCAWVFRAEGSTLTWRCARGCASHGSREYDSPEQARLMARGLERNRPGPPNAFLKLLGGLVERPKRRG